MSVKIDHLVSLLRERSQSHPHKACFHYLVSGDLDGRVISWSFADLDWRARATAVRLSRQVRSGERVLLLLGPGLDFMSGFFGCLYAGCVAVPSYPPDPRRLRQTLPRMASIAANAGATAVLTTSDLAAMRPC